VFYLFRKDVPDGIVCFYRNCVEHFVRVIIYTDGNKLRKRFSYFCRKIYKMKFFAAIAFLLLGSVAGQAQVDTITTNSLKLNTEAFKEGKSSFAVYFEDSLGNRISTADIWDRTIHFATNENGQKIYRFEWKWYRRDSLLGTVQATGLLPSLKPLTHDAEYTGRGQRSFVFANDVVTIPEGKQRTAKDSAFNVVLNPAAYEFPMDLEIFPLLPFKKTGQQFAIAFYEPGTAKSAYYPLTVTGKEDLLLPGAQKLRCWLLRIDYAPGSYATFWISDATREVVKMKEYFRGRYRYKVRLY